MRGLPGSGKSTKAESLAGTRVSADMFFMEDGEYKFDRTKLGQAHAWCQASAEGRLKAGVYPVIVDNTNLSQSELMVYAKIAKSAGAAFEVAYSPAPWAMDVDECTKRNTHGVPRESIERMLSRFWRPGETITLEEILDTPP